MGVFKWANAGVDKLKLCEEPQNQEYRYLLEYQGDKPIVCFGVNPSVASKEIADKTLRNIATISKQNGYDGWIMFNVSSQRSTDPNGMSQKEEMEKHKENLKNIEERISKMREVNVWLGFGGLIESRPYLKEYLTEIYKIFEKNGKTEWWCAGTTKKGHPKHPSRLANKTKLERFKMQEYMEK